MTTNNKQIIDGKRKEFRYPITYNKKSATKEDIDIKRLHEVDALSFGSKIGFVTNCSTYWWSLLYDYKKDSDEYNEIIKRLKLCRLIQGGEIDKSKGIEVEDMPKHYTSYVKDMNDLDKKLVVSKKPYFQKYIYPSLNNEYNNFAKHRNKYSLIEYDINWQDNKDEEFINYMKFKNPVLDNNSTMNKICHYLEKEISEIKRNYKQQDLDIVKDIMIDNNYHIKLEYESFMSDLINEYKLFKKEERNKKCNMTIEDTSMKNERFNNFKKMINKKAHNKIENEIELANLVVYCGYKNKNEVGKDFVWDIFGKEVFSNIEKKSNNNIAIPVKCSCLEKEFVYLGENYKEEIFNNDNI